MIETFTVLIIIFIATFNIYDNGNEKYRALTNKHVFNYAS